MPAPMRAVRAQFDAACRDAQLVSGGMKGELRLGFTMHAARGIVRHACCGGAEAPEIIDGSRGAARL